MENEENAHKPTPKPIFIESGIILYQDQNITIIRNTKPRLTFKNTLSVTLEDLKKFFLIKYGSYSKIGQAWGGLGKTYAFRVLNGTYKIKQNKTIQKIADSVDLPFERVKQAFS